MDLNNVQKYAELLNPPNTAKQRKKKTRKTQKAIYKCMITSDATLKITEVSVKKEQTRPTCSSCQILNIVCKHHSTNPPKSG